MTSIAEQLIESLNAVEVAIFEGQDATRQQLALAARKLFHKLETTEEKTMRLAVEEPIMFSVLQALIDIGLFEGWAAAGGGEKNVNQLASISKKDMEPELLCKASIDDMIRFKAATNLPTRPSITPHGSEPYYRGNSKRPLRTYALFPCYRGFEHPGRPSPSD